MMQTVIMLSPQKDIRAHVLGMENGVCSFVFGRDLQSCKSALNDYSLLYLAEIWRLRKK